MTSKVFSALPLGYSGQLIEIEGDITNGLPRFNIVGMADKTIAESTERVKSAIINSNFTFPDRKLTINLAPADLPKDGAHLDLAIALSVLVLGRQLLETDLDNSLFVGELALDGKIRPVKGIINILETAKHHKLKTAYIPARNLPQASLVEDLDIIPVPDLKSLFLHLKGVTKLLSGVKGSNPERTGKPSSTPPKARKKNKEESISPLLDHIRGQKTAKRALAIAIAGRHNILISGPPGSGKTLLARTALNLLPDPSKSEQIAVTKLHSLAGLATDAVTTRPFRTPHHTASPISIIGGGLRGTPGEISLAHCGVLFLDELPEYPRSVLETLRQPLEDRSITISRANVKVTYPADFMLVATMNPCPCGYLGDPDHECACTSREISSYKKKLSGPLLDRIDIIINVKKVENSDLLKPIATESTEHAVVKSTIETALSHQRARYSKTNFYNSSLSSHQVSKRLKLDQKATALLSTANKTLNLSARAYFKTIKVAQTIADLESADIITEAHISESLTYRQR